MQQFLSQHIRLTDLKSSYNRPLLGKNEQLKKAFGDKVKIIYDLTLGLGEDAWILARLGYQVYGFEQDPVVFQGVANALKQARLDPLFTTAAQRLQIQEIDSWRWLQQGSQKIENCYIDPMFDDQELGSALPKKHMQKMRQWIGASPVTAEQWLQLAKQKVKFKIVIKRARLAPSTTEKPNYQIWGKAHRYDIYLANPLEPAL